MVKHSEPNIDPVFSALADPTRRSILARLAQGEASVSDLAKPHDMTLPAVMKHLAVLDDAGLIERRKIGRTVTCTLTAGPLMQARAWLDEHVRFWTERLDALGQFLEDTEERSQ